MSCGCWLEDNDSLLLLMWCPQPAFLLSPLPHSALASRQAGFGTALLTADEGGGDPLRLGDKKGSL